MRVVRIIILETHLEEARLMYVCICHSVTDRQIRQAVDEGARSLDALARRLKVSTGCGRCSECARGVLEQALAEASAPAPTPVFATG
jgi:bacterioferritin-associated ferredoxin